MTDYLYTSGGFPSSPSSGDSLVINGLLYDWTGTAWKVRSVTSNRVEFTATANQATKTGLTYFVGSIDCYINGAKMLLGSDFTATNGTSVTFTPALDLADEVQLILGSNASSSDNYYTKAEVHSLLGYVALANTVAPALSGTATTGNTLSTSNGTWTGTPAPAFTYQWQRGASNIAGATNNTYTIVTDDETNTLKCVVTATNALGSATIASNSSATIPVYVADPHWANVTLLLQGAGANGSSVFTDLSSVANTITKVGTPTVSTSISKFGGSSIDLSTQGDAFYVPASGIDMNYGTSTDFTWEFWIYPTAWSSYTKLIAQWSGGFQFMFMASGGIAIEDSSGTSYISNPIAQSDVALNTWHHMAVSRQGSSMKFFLNGVGHAFTSNLNFAPQNTSIGIGKAYTQSGNTIDSYIDDLRITNGVGRYSADFTPPTAAFPTS